MREITDEDRKTAQRVVDKMTGADRFYITAAELAANSVTAAEILANVINVAPGEFDDFEFPGDTE